MFLYKNINDTFNFYVNTYKKFNFLLLSKKQFITHPFAVKFNFTKLTCVKYITSVHSEPGSDSFFIF